MYQRLSSKSSLLYCLAHLLCTYNTKSQKNKHETTTYCNNKLRSQTNAPELPIVWVCKVEQRACLWKVQAAPGKAAVLPGRAAVAVEMNKWHPTKPSRWDLDLIHPESFMHKTWFWIQWIQWNHATATADHFPPVSLDQFSSSEAFECVQFSTCGSAELPGCFLQITNQSSPGVPKGWNLNI